MHANMQATAHSNGRVSSPSHSNALSDSAIASVVELLQSHHVAVQALLLGGNQAGPAAAAAIASYMQSTKV